MARTILGVNSVVFDSTGIVANTIAQWTSVGGGLAQVTLVHNLNAYVPGHANFNAQHALKITAQQLSGYAAASSNDGITWTSTDQNTIVGTAAIVANGVRNGTIYVERLHSVTE